MNNAPDYISKAMKNQPLQHEKESLEDYKDRISVHSIDLFLNDHPEFETFYMLLRFEREGR